MKQISIIQALDEFPRSLASEDDQRQWQATHELSDELYEPLPGWTNSAASSKQ